MTPDVELTRLPDHDLAPERAELIRRRAHAALRARAARGEAPGPRWSARYHRVVEPLALLALGFAYLALAVGDTLALLR